MSTDWSGRRLHFVGIGGAGMSGLALVCARLGAAVTGSDRAESPYMERLRAAGLEPVVGHDAANVPEGAELVVSTAIAADNPELAAAREAGAPVVHRGALLAELCAEKRLIAVAGTHGKSTTTAMIAWALRGIGADPAFFVGAEVIGMGGEVAKRGPRDPFSQPHAANAGWGEGEWVVAEADESDGSFLELSPEIAVVTNVEMEHHAHWGSLAALHKAFAEFVAPASGVALPADGSLDELAGEARRVGFDAKVPGPADLALLVPGAHNRANARAALAAVELAGLDADGAARALAGFPGVSRRLEPKGRRGAVHIYDDYAHHPSEVRAALSALREQKPRHLVAVFQPHLYSRTRAFAEQFGAALALADEAVVLDVYPAREQPVGELAGVSGLDVARAAAERMGGRRVLWAPRAERAREALEATGEREGVLVTLGAGDVYKLAEALVREEQ